MKKTSVVQTLGAMLLLTTSCVAAFAQSIPASSADSGRRAVIAVNQDNIYNNINNANNNAINAGNLANWAVNLSNKAQNTANTAQNTANTAINIGNVAVDGVNRLTNAVPSGGIVMGGEFVEAGTKYSMICVRGFPWGYPAICPDGSGPIVFVKSTVDGNGGSAGGGGSN